MVPTSQCPILTWHIPGMFWKQHAVFCWIVLSVPTCHQCLIHFFRKLDAALFYSADYVCYHDCASSTVSAIQKEVLQLCGYPHVHQLSSLECHKLLPLHFFTYLPYPAASHYSLCNPIHPHFPTLILHDWLLNVVLLKAMARTTQSKLFTATPEMLPLSWKEKWSKPCKCC